MPIKIIDGASKEPWSLTPESQAVLVCIHNHSRERPNEQTTMQRAKGIHILVDAKSRRIEGIPLKVFICSVCKYVEFYAGSE